MTIALALEGLKETKRVPSQASTEREPVQPENAWPSLTRDNDVLPFALKMVLPRRQEAVLILPLQSVRAPNIRGGLAPGKHAGLAVAPFHAHCALGNNAGGSDVFKQHLQFHGVVKGPTHGMAKRWRANHKRFVAERQVI